MKVEVVDGFDPLPVSSYSETSYGFQIIKKSILDVFPQLTVAPGRKNQRIIYLKALNFSFTYNINVLGQTHHVSVPKLWELYHISKNQVKICRNDKAHDLGKLLCLVLLASCLALSHVKSPP